MNPNNGFTYHQPKMISQSVYLDDCPTKIGSIVTFKGFTNVPEDTKLEVEDVTPVKGGWDIKFKPCPTKSKFN